MMAEQVDEIATVAEQGEISENQPVIEENQELSGLEAEERAETPVAGLEDGKQVEQKSNPGDLEEQAAEDKDVEGRVGDEGVAEDAAVQESAEDAIEAQGADPEEDVEGSQTPEPPQIVRLPSADDDQRSNVESDDGVLPDQVLPGGADGAGDAPQSYVALPTGAEDEDIEQPELQDIQAAQQATEDVSTGTEQEHAPSPSLPFDKDATATVKFVLLPTQQVATLRCALTQTLSQLKAHFSKELKIPSSAIVLMLDGNGTADSKTLWDLGVGPNGTIRLEMQSADPENQPIKAFKPQQEYTMPDVITVRVPENGGYRDVVVEIERDPRKKPFLGGYRHKQTGVEYHHASGQTRAKLRPPPDAERFCRDTQTMKQKHVVQQTTNHTSTQMTKIGAYVSNMTDKLVTPGKYTTAEEYGLNMLNKVVVLQKYYRRWLAKKYVDKVREDKKRRQEWERKEELRKKKEKEDRIRKEFERRMNPKTKEDFDLLYHALEKWRKDELENLYSTLSGAELKAALCQLLDQETQLIASIGRHKLEADKENKDKSVLSFLDKAASAKKWRGPDGKVTEMDTPFTLRAQQLRDIYNSVSMKYLTQDERLDVLLTLKHTVKEHDCKLTQDIIQLVDREADLLMRGTKESNLEGLRKRINTLFLQYIKTPTFNPEAARLLKVPQDPSALRKNIYFCPSCNQYLPSTEFGLSSNSRHVGKCRKCSKTDNDARVRQDYSHYRFLLKSMRKQEDSYGDGSKIAFLMQENDLRHLVENVWSSQSMLSAWDDLYDLTLVRWEGKKEWSPWNCILLTKEEASAHEKLSDLEEAYGSVFIHKVKHKHTLARNYFSRLPIMAEHMRTNPSGGSGASVAVTGPSVSGKSVPVSVK